MYNLSENHPAILRIKEPEADDRKPVGSHHGTPDLTKHDIELLEAHYLWVTTAIEAQKNHHCNNSYKSNWLPGYSDWIKSRLFWRIRSGKKPLKYPPPTCYSCPWYELIEIKDAAHSTAECIRVFDYEGNGSKFVAVAQCRYDYISGPEKNITIEDPIYIRYGQYKFRAWNGQVEWTSIDGPVYRPGGYIQFDGEIEES